MFDFLRGKRKNLEREIVRIEPDKLTHFRYRNLEDLKVLVVQIGCNSDGCDGLGMGVEVLIPATGIKNINSQCSKCLKLLAAEVEFN